MAKETSTGLNKDTSMGLFSEMGLMIVDNVETERIWTPRRASSQFLLIPRSGYLWCSEKCKTDGRTERQTDDFGDGNELRFPESLIVAFISDHRHHVLDVLKIALPMDKRTDRRMDRRTVPQGPIGCVHVQMCCVKPKFWNLYFEREKLFH